jgi:hypothetical protein
VSLPAPPGTLTTIYSTALVVSAGRKFIDSGWISTSGWENEGLYASAWRINTVGGPGAASLNNVAIGTLCRVI